MPLAPTGFKADRHDLVIVNVGNPLAGAPLIWPCPNNHVVQVVGVGVRVATDATVFNRYVCVAMEDGGSLSVFSPPVKEQAASLAWDYEWAMGIVGLDGSADDKVYSPLSSAMLLKTGEDLHVLGVAFADQISSATIRYYEWNED